MSNLPYNQIGFNIKQYRNQLCNEITKTVREQWKFDYVEKADIPYQLENVKCRTSNHLVIDEPRTQWKDNFYRRHHNLNLGYFNVSHLPYSCLGGEVTLDTRDLVLKVYKDYLQEEENSFEAKSKNKEDDKASVTSENADDQGEKASAGAESPVLVPKRTERHTKALWKHIRQSNDQIQYVSSGQFYKNVNEILKARRGNRSHRHVQKPKNACMQIQSMSSLNDIMIGKTYAVALSTTPGVTSRPSSTSTVSVMEKELELSESLDEDRPVEEPESLSDVQLPPDAGKMMEDFRRERRERIKRDHVKKLEAIHMILLTLTNMKTSHLRSKNPLTKDAILVLQKEQSSDKELMSRLANGRYSRCHRMSLSTDTLASTVEMSGQSPKLNALTVPQVQVQTDSLPPVTAQVPNGLGMARVRKPSAGAGLLVAANNWVMRARRVSTATGATADVVETWDDLVMRHEKRDHLITKLQITGMFLGALSRYQRRSAEADSEKKMPVWQTVANEKSHISSQKRKSTDPEARLKQIQKDHESLKVTLARENKVELFKLDRERLVLFDYKFNVLEDLPPLFEQHYRQMKKAMKNFTGNVDMLDLQPTEWFQRLKEDTNTVSTLSDLDVQALMQKMGRFSQVDGKSIPQAKAKLCLLLMSLPAYDVCQVPMQRAFKLVLEEILVGTPGQLERWLKLRRLPLVLI